jgi:peroxiredoxin
MTTNSTAPGMPGPGQPAPGFSLGGSGEDLPGAGDRISLDALRGAPVILAFYPADWSPVCGDQMSLYQLVWPEFARYQAALLGVSVDGVWCHRAFADRGRGGLEPPLARRRQPGRRRHPDRPRPAARQAATGGVRPT